MRLLPITSLVATDWMTFAEGAPQWLCINLENSFESASWEMGRFQHLTKEVQFTHMSQQAFASPLPGIWIRLETDTVEGVCHNDLFIFIIKGACRTLAGLGNYRHDRTSLCVCPNSAHKHQSREFRISHSSVE